MNSKLLLLFGFLCLLSLSWAQDLTIDDLGAVDVEVEVGEEELGEAAEEGAVDEGELELGEAQIPDLNLDVNVDVDITL